MRYVNIKDTVSLFQELVNWHRPRVAALLEAGVDILSFVTIPAQKEAEAIELLLHEFPNCQAFLTYSCKVVKRLRIICFVNFPLKATLHGQVGNGMGHLGHDEAMEAGGREFEPRPGHYSRASF